MEEWVAERLGPIAARWFIPQASLDGLVVAAGLVGDAHRRVDFLVHAPWLDPFVVEIDGWQHDEAAAIDAERDALLASAGVPVIRVPVDELRAGTGPGLDAIEDRWQPAPPIADETTVTMLWAPVVTHRAVFAVLEAMMSGTLRGRSWSITVDDPIDVVRSTLPPYLDLIAAVDRLWGGSVMPAVVWLSVNGEVTAFRQVERRYAVMHEEAEAPSPDVLLVLEPDRSPIDELPSSREAPMIVVRSASVPVQLQDELYERPGRIEVRSEGDDTAHALRTVLRSVFAKEDFLEGQLDAVFEVIEGRDCAVLLPTGGGKSLIYQLAGLCLPGRTLVVDPLVALMEDQVEGLARNGIDRVAQFSGQQTRLGRTEQLLDEVRSGGALFIFASPERLQQDRFRKAVRGLAELTPINLSVVDEAHCVSEWGHDFRTSYLTLGRTLRAVCRDPDGVPAPILALTGTASRAVLRDVLIELGIERESDRSVVRPGTFDRPELRFSIAHAQPREASAALTGALQRLPGRFNIPATDFFRPRGERTCSGIVFCPYVSGPSGVVDVADAVGAVLGVRPAIYAGGAPRGFDRRDWEEIKRRNADSFKRNETALLVSTKAFGMGIDKPNVRFVAHLGIPGSIESYYQEVGRGGRDRKRAECLLVSVEYDAERNRRLLSEEIGLEEVRDSADVGKQSRDDVTNQLWFHLNSFRGVDAELDDLRSVLAEVDWLGTKQSYRAADGTHRERTQGSRTRNQSADIARGSQRLPRRLGVVCVHPRSRTGGCGPGGEHPLGVRPAQSTRTRRGDQGAALRRD